MKGYYKIDSYLGYTLWESTKFGDEMPCIVLNNEGKEVGETYLSLIEFVDDLTHP